MNTIRGLASATIVGLVSALVLSGCATPTVSRPKPANDGDAPR